METSLCETRASDLTEAQMPSRCPAAAVTQLYQAASLETCHILKKQTDEVEVYHNHMEE